MAAVGFDLYSRLLAEAVEEQKAIFEEREPVVARQQAVVDLPVEAHLPDDYVPDEAQKLELYRRLARARTPGDIAAFRQEVTDRFGPLPAPVLRLVEVAELRLAAETAGVTSISREEGQLVVRFGAGLSRATAMRLLVVRGTSRASGRATSRSPRTRSASACRATRSRAGRSPRRSSPASSPPSPSSPEIGPRPSLSTDRPRWRMMAAHGGGRRHGIADVRKRSARWTSNSRLSASSR